MLGGRVGVRAGAAGPPRSVPPARPRKALAAVLERVWFNGVHQPRSNLLFKRVIQTSGAFAPTAITL